MAEDKAAQLEKGSLMGSQYFMVQMPDGTFEKRLKVPVNADPGVHSSFNLDDVFSFFSYFYKPQIMLYFYCRDTLLVEKQQLRLLPKELQPKTRKNPKRVINSWKKVNHKASLA